MLSGATPSKNEKTYWDGNIPWVSSQEFTETYIDKTTYQITKLGLYSCSTQLHKKGTLVMVVRSGILQHTIPVAILNVPASINQDVKAFELDDSVIAKYLMYFIKGTNDILLDEWRKDKSTVDNISQNKIYDTLIPLPNVIGQKAIVDYLDVQCSNIDIITADIQSEIDTLEKYKRSVITEAVTKGLDKNVEMKDSGLEWIEKIPSDWSERRIKHICTFSKGLPITKADLKENGYAVISYGQVHAKFNTGTGIDSRLIRFVDNKFLKLYPQSLCHKNDFIFADTSEDYEGVGNSVFVDTDDTIFAGYHTFVATPDRYIGNPKFLAYLFQTDVWRNQIRGRVSGVKVFSITQTIIKNTEVIYPDSIEIQNEIVTYLDSKCRGIDAIINKKQKQIEILNTYKKSLIYEYVTGKKEVPSSWQN